MRRDSRSYRRGHPPSPLNVFIHARQTQSGARLLLAAADMLVVAAAFLLAVLIRFGLDGAVEYLDRHAASLPLLCVAYLLVFYVAGMYEREVLVRRGELLHTGGLAVALAVVASIVLLYARFQPIGRGVMALSVLLILAGTLGLRQTLRWAFRGGLMTRRVLVAGEGPDAEAVLDLIAGPGRGDFVPAGVVAPGPALSTTSVRGIPVVGTLDQLRERAEALRVDTVILATPPRRDDPILRLLRPVRYAGVEVIDLVTLHETLAQSIPLDRIDDEWLLGAAMNSSALHVRRVKRTLDLAAAAVALILLSPVFLLAALVVRLTSRGPALHRQIRGGLDGRPFTLLKFRTMRVDAEAASGAVWSAPGDPRVTAVGRVLRRWRIDELPQLVNVLRGEMSLVGPRPERPEFVETLAAAIPYYRERFAVPPGLTGWAQVQYPYAGTLEGQRRKLEYDLYYIKHMSFWLDVRILARTAVSVLRGPRHRAEDDLSAAGRPSAEDGTAAG